MSQHETIFDHIAEAFRSREEETVPVEALLDEAVLAGFIEAWDIEREALTNAMSVRGIALQNGRLSEIAAPANFDPVSGGYEQFLKTAVKIINAAEYPIDALDLISLSGLATEAIPMASMSRYLKRVNIHLIPGVGFWRSPDYTDPSGRIVSRRPVSEKVAAIMRYFRSQGWPLVSRDVERMTGGAVASHFMSRYAVVRSGRLFVSIGSGMFVPADQAQEDLPLSPNVALAMLALTPDHIIDDQDDLRLFRVASILERKGLAAVKRSRTTRSGTRRQTARVTISSAGRELLEQKARLAKDEF